ncbi:ThuA domain-containing protein [Amnibacterium sp.]|uniref:ThuA domain-containing protein n=1 Tax=Amnibacterium sp. TaxID=1872496 RepID=UPI00261E9DC0|nr:ThuA domain-containing protein [Amnibacterium sp.]MCU1474631.1 ThuA protein [Amnibacterium sp.]
MMTGERVRATVVSGGGRFADPWHDFPETSRRLGEVAAEAGFDVAVIDDVPAALARAAALLILDVGRPSESDAVEDAVVRAALLAAHERGAGILAMHAAVMSFPAVPEWEAIAGGVWVDGVSMHPPYGEARVRVTDTAHPITAGVADFALNDERYTALRIDPGVQVLAVHEHEGQAYPLLWTRTGATGRVVTDVLGHDAASYEAGPHRVLLARAMRWAAGDARIR